MASGLFGGITSALFGTLQAVSEYAKGWGNNIEWHSLREGQKLVKETGKPAMVIFHKSWCRACKALRPRFANSHEIEKLSNDMIMISVEDDEDRNVDMRPDGSYVPRIIFLDQDGKVITSVYNQGSDKYKYYYSDTDSIIKNMKEVIRSSGKSFHHSTGGHPKIRYPAMTNNPRMQRNHDELPKFANPNRSAVHD